MLTDIVLNPSDPIIGIAFELLSSVGAHPDLQRLERGLYRSDRALLTKLVRDPIELAESLPDAVPPVGLTHSLEEWKDRNYDTVERSAGSFVVEFSQEGRGFLYRVYEVIPATTLRAAAEEAKRLSSNGTVMFELCDGGRKRASCRWVDPWLEVFRIEGNADFVNAKDAVTAFPGLRVIRQRIETP